MLLQLHTRNPYRLKGTQARRKRTIIISGKDFPVTWKWTNNFGNRYSGRQLFFGVVDAISDLFF